MKTFQPNFSLDGETTLSAAQARELIDARRAANRSGFRTLDAALDALQADIDAGTLHPTKGRYADTARRGHRGHLETAFQISKTPGSIISDVIQGVLYAGFRPDAETLEPKPLKELPSYYQRAATAIRKGEIDALEIDAYAHELIEDANGRLFHKDTDANTYQFFSLSA